MSLKPTSINATLFPSKKVKHLEETGVPHARDLGDGSDDETLASAPAAQLQASGKIILVDWAEVCLFSTHRVAVGARRVLFGLVEAADQTRSLLRMTQKTL